MAFEEEFDTDDDELEPGVKLNTPAEPAFEEEFDTSDDEDNAVPAAPAATNVPPPLPPAATNVPPPLPPAATNVPPPLPPAAKARTTAPPPLPPAACALDHGAPKQATPIQFQNDGSFMEQFLQQQAAAAAPEEPPLEKDEVVGEVLHTAVVTAEHADARLAKFTSEIFSTLQWGRNRAAASVRDGRVRVNMERCGANRVLQAGDSVTVHALPPCTMTTARIEALLSERTAAKCEKDYERADAAYSELQAGGVRLHDKEGTWLTNEGRSGQIPAAIVKEVNLAVPSGKKSNEEREAEREVERRRVKNRKKKEAKQRKEALNKGGAGECDGEPDPKRVKS